MMRRQLVRVLRGRHERWRGTQQYAHLLLEPLRQLLQRADACLLLPHVALQAADAQRARHPLRARQQHRLAAARRQRRHVRTVAQGVAHLLGACRPCACHMRRQRLRVLLLMHK